MIEETIVGESSPVLEKALVSLKINFEIENTHNSTAIEENLCVFKTNYLFHLQSYYGVIDYGNNI